MRPSEALAKHREAIREILFRYPVSNPRIFGSVARGEDTVVSDIDILVARAGTLTFFDLARLERELTQLTSIRFDIRTEGEFSSRTFGRISQDFVPL